MTTSWSAPCSAAPAEDLLLISAEGQSIRFHATDEALRPMGRATSGVLGMRFNAGDELLSMDVVHEGAQVLVATERGYAKRTDIEEYPVQGRGGKGVLTIQYDRRRGKLVGALIVDLDTEVYAITSSGGVIRTLAKEVRKAKRQTMGVRLMNLSEGDSLVAIARNADADPDRRRTAGAAAGRRADATARLTERRRDRALRLRARRPRRRHPRCRPSRPHGGPAPMASPQHVGPAPAGATRRSGRARRPGPARRTRAGRRPPGGRRGWRRCSSSGSTRGRC